MCTSMLSLRIEEDDAPGIYFLNRNEVDELADSAKHIRLSFEDSALCLSRYSSFNVFVTKRICLLNGYIRIKMIGSS
jgi:hypothetical protein